MTAALCHSPVPTSVFALLLTLAIAPPAHADADFLSKYQGEFFCVLKSSATASLGKPPVAPAPQPGSAEERMQQLKQKTQDLEKAMQPVPEARLSIVLRKGSVFLDLHFSKVPPRTSLRDLEINVAPASSASPTVRRAAGALPGQTVLATATATSFTVYWAEPETSDGPVYRQLHLTAAAGAIDLVIWVIDSNGRRGAGRACVMERL